MNRNIGDIRLRSALLLFVVSSLVYVLLYSQISFATSANQSIVKNGNDSNIPCMGPDGKPQLPCPPEGKCLGPDDRPIPCPRVLSLAIIFEKETGGNKTMFNGTISRTLHNLTGTLEQITSQYYKLGQEFDKKSGIKVGDPVTFIFKNSSRITVPYTGNYHNPVSERFLEDILIPLDGDHPCWINIEDDHPIQMHIANCGNGGIP